MSLAGSTDRKPPATVVRAPREAPMNAHITMLDPFIPRVGGTMSADIAVPEHERVVQFYSRVLGTGETPLWREDLMNNRGMPVIGLGPQSPEYADLPLQWMPHIQVEDVGRSAARALELGGREILHGKAEDGTSLWAALYDPSGAAFGLIPVVTEEQIPKADGDATGSVGHIAWVALATDDASSSSDFYREVVGWSVKEVEMVDGDDRYLDHDMLGGDGRPAAGICHARGVNEGLPPIWLLHIPVGDLAESLRLVGENGGKVIAETTRGRDGYAYGVIEDPVGVRIALVPG